MGKYLYQVKYTTEGMKGVLAEGGSKRVEEVSRVAQAMGGSLESLHFSYGEYDAILIIDLPSKVNVAASLLMVEATGTATAKVTELMTANEMDEASKKVLPYRAAGQ